MAAPVNPTTGTSRGAIVASLTLLAASVLLFLAIWFALPTQASHYMALLWIGILSLIFATVSYFGRAFTRAADALQLMSWGYAGFGFALLIGSLVLGAPVIGTVTELVGLAVVVVLIGIVGGLTVWRSGSARTTQAREERREQWRASTPRSAFDYTTARPNVPPSGAPPAEGSPPTAPPGASQ